MISETKTNVFIQKCFINYNMEMPILNLLLHTVRFLKYLTSAGLDAVLMSMSVS